MSKESGIVLAIYAFIILIILATVAVMPIFEAKSFNECTGGNATYMTALTTELRIENCNREDTHGTK